MHRPLTRSLEVRGIDKKYVGENGVKMETWSGYACKWWQRQQSLYLGLRGSRRVAGGGGASGDDAPGDVPLWKFR